MLIMLKCKIAFFLIIISVQYIQYVTCAVNLNHKKYGNREVRSLEFSNNEAKDNKQPCLCRGEDLTCSCCFDIGSNKFFDSSSCVSVRLHENSKNMLNPDETLVKSGLDDLRVKSFRDITLKICKLFAEMIQICGTVDLNFDSFTISPGIKMYFMNYQVFNYVYRNFSFKPSENANELTIKV